MIFDEYTKLNVLEFKSVIISSDEQQKQSRGKKADLQEHLQMLRIEFIGKTNLEFFHAATCVFIRRKLNLDFCKSNFFRLWESEADFLCKNLSLRWLISACDTIFDESDNNSDKALALTCSVLINTIKLYETEAMISNNNHKKYDFDVVKDLREKALFDGLTPFMLGGGDMVKNLHDRVNTYKGNNFSEKILKECFARIDRMETVYGRFKSQHKSNSTIW